jgi:hypothetical protein
VFFWVRRWDSHVGVNISEKSTASIFGAKVKMETACLSETLVSTYESTRPGDPEEQHSKSVYISVNSTGKVISVETCNNYRFMCMMVCINLI